MPNQKVIKLNDGNTIPQLGLGVWQASKEETGYAVKSAIKSGYRHIDTAAIYKNEEGVGQGVRDSDITRSDIFITTKVWNDAHGYQQARSAFDASLKKLQMEYVDLLLVHWPVPENKKYVETWQALIDIQKQGKARSIGVSNFNSDHLETIIKETGVTPVLNQIELHPLFQRNDLRQFHNSLNIKTQAWSPLGQGQVLSNKIIASIAEKYQKSPAQVILRWHLQLGNIVIPKSVNSERIKENFNITDFTLEDEDMAKIAAMEANYRIGPDPLNFK